VRGIGVMPQPLRLGIRFNQPDLVFVAAGQTQIGQRFGIDRKDSAGCAIFGRHVRDRRAIGQGQMLQTVAIELDELGDDAALAQHLGHRQHQIGCGRAFRQLAAHPETDDLRNQHRRRLAEHRRFGLDAADAPAEHPDAVDHRRVRVGAENSVGERPGRAVFLGCHHDARQKLQIDLMHDAGARRNNLEVLERLLAPAQEAVAFLVALELDFDVALERVGLAELVDLHRVIDDQFGRYKRIDLVGIAAELDDRIAHRRKIDYARHAGEVLQHDAGRHECDFGFRFLLSLPVRYRLDFLRRDVESILVTQQILEQDLHRIGQAG
jgi:hypothetical protein